MAGLVIVLSVLATFWCFSRLATASVYPTKPTATTIYQAGAPAEVRWTEDNKKPLLNLTGVMQIDLYEGNSVSCSPADKSVGKNYAANLISRYYPSKKIIHDCIRHIWQPLQRTWIRSRCPRRSTSQHRSFRRITTRCELCLVFYVLLLRTTVLNSTLHFVTTEPRQTIYTADFGIIPNAFSRSSSAIYSPSSTAVTVTDTVTSRIISTETPQPTASQKGSAGLGLSWALGGHSTPGGQFAIDADKMKFRMTFIVWPALVGLSMAL